MMTVRKAETRGGVLVSSVVPVTAARSRGCAVHPGQMTIALWFADRLGNTLSSYFAPDSMPPAAQCGQMISYVFAFYAFSVGTCYSADLAFFP